MKRARDDSFNYLDFFANSTYKHLLARILSHLDVDTLSRLRDAGMYKKVIDDFRVLDRACIAKNPYIDMPAYIQEVCDKGAKFMDVYDEVSVFIDKQDIIWVQEPSNVQCRSEYLQCNETVCYLSIGSPWTILSTDKRRLCLLYNCSKIPSIELPLTCHVSAICCGENHFVVLTQNGEAWSYGCNEHGQLGLEEPTDWLYSLTKVPIIGLVTDVACRSSGTMFIAKNGCVYACGSNEDGELGIGDLSKAVVRTPQKVDLGEPVVSVGCGSTYSVFVTAEGMVYSCGSNAYGAMGEGDYINEIRATPKPIYVDVDTVVIKVICKHFTTILLTKTGSVYFCGTVWCDYTKCGWETSVPCRIYSKFPIVDAKISEFCVVILKAAPLGFPAL